MRTLIKQLSEALQAAHDHLQYCSYGDSWERSCALSSKLPEQIHEALEASKNFSLIANIENNKQNTQP